MTADEAGALLFNLWWTAGRITLGGEAFATSLLAARPTPEVCRAAAQEDIDYFAGRPLKVDFTRIKDLTLVELLEESNAEHFYRYDTNAGRGMGQGAVRRTLQTLGSSR